MTTGSLAELRSRLYEAYATQHAGVAGDQAAALVYRRDIRPLLPPSTAGPVVDLGCGRGALVRLMQLDGYDAEGVDISREQAALARAARVPRVCQNFRAARITVWQVVSACYPIALAAETGTLRGHIVTQNLTFAARKSAELVDTAERSWGSGREVISGITQAGNLA